MWDEPNIFMTKYHFLHDQSWISSWKNSISNELDIITRVIASQSSVDCDVISTRLWRHHQNENRVSETRGRCVKIVVFIVIDGFVFVVVSYLVSHLEARQCIEEYLLKPQGVTCFYFSDPEASIRHWQWYTLTGYMKWFLTHEFDALKIYNNLRYHHENELSLHLNINYYWTIMQSFKTENLYIYSLSAIYFSAAILDWYETNNTVVPSAMFLLWDNISTVNVFATDSD